MEPIHPITPGMQGALIAVTILYVFAALILALTLPDNVIHEWANDVIGWIHWTKP